MPSDLVNLLDPRQMLAVVLSFSVILYALSSNLARIHARRLSATSSQLLEKAKITWLPRAIGELLRWIFYLGLPYTALVLGYDTVRALGIWNIDWIGTLVYAGILAAGMAIVFLWVWRPFAQAQHPHTIDESRWGWPRHVVETIYQEAHWAFYRSGPILWLGDAYWGSFVGLALVLIEGWSNPEVRENAHDISRADAPLWTGSLAVMSTVVFVFTQNAWYALAIHALLDLGLRGIIGFPKPEDLMVEPAMPYLPDDQQFDSV